MMVWPPRSQYGITRNARQKAGGSPQINKFGAERVTRRYPRCRRLRSPWNVKFSDRLTDSRLRAPASGKPHPGSGLSRLSFKTMGPPVLRENGGHRCNRPSWPRWCARWPPPSFHIAGRTSASHRRSPQSTHQSGLRRPGPATMRGHRARRRRATLPLYPPQFAERSSTAPPRYNGWRPTL